MQGKPEKQDKTAFILLKLQMRAGRAVQVTVQGVSMEPTLHSGDIVSVSPCNSYATGDIAAFHYGHEGLLLHRIIRIENGFMHLRGDNALRIEIVPADSLLGAVRV